MNFLRRGAWAAVFLSLWFVLLAFPDASSGRYLDQSYGFALGHFLKTRAQAGVDYVFTYGPLGYVTVGPFFPGLFALRYVWGIVFAAAGAGVFTRLAMLMPAYLGALLVAVVFAVAPQSDQVYLCVLVAAAFLLVLDDAWSTGWLLGVGALLATLGLVKFTFFVLATTCVVIVSLAPPRGRRLRAATTLAGAFLFTTLVLWVVTGQSLLHLPRYLWWSYEVARGYSDGMSVTGSRAHLSAAFLGAGLLAAGIVVALPGVLSRRSVFGVAVVGVGLFMAWKEGLVRQDPPHVAVFFEFATFAAILLLSVCVRPGDGAAALQRALFALAALHCVAVRRSAAGESASRLFSYARTRESVARAASILFHPVDRLKFCESVWRSQEEEWALPKVRAVVGAAPLDVLTIDQTVVFYNHFNWHPRPMFQSYSAYTPALAKLNAAFLRGARAPRYLLIRWSSIDARFPAGDDAPTLFEILRLYRPVLRERDYQLFERRSAGDVAHPHGEVVLDERLRFGKRLRLSLDPGELHTLEVRAEPTTATRIRRFFFRAPRLAFVVEQPKRVQRRYELVPELASVPFVLSPLLEGNNDLGLIYEGRGRRITAIRFLEDKELGDAFGDSVRVVVRKYSGVLPHGESAAE